LSFESGVKVPEGVTAKNPGTGLEPGIHASYVASYYRPNSHPEASLLTDTLSCHFPIFIGFLTSFLFRIFSGLEGKKGFFDPFFSVCSQVWSHASLPDILPTFILGGVRLGKSHHRIPSCSSRRARKRGLE
jgi:hypothetical protein